MNERAQRTRPTAHTRRTHKQTRVAATWLGQKHTKIMLTYIKLAAAAPATTPEAQVVLCVCEK